MSGSYEIVIPDWTPTLTNQLLKASHWAQAHRLKEADARLVGVYARLSGVPRASGPRRVDLAVRGWRVGNLPDRDAFWKSLLDALVLCGMLVNDDPARCLLGGVDVTRSKTRETRIRLHDLPALPATEGGEKPPISLVELRAVLEQIAFSATDSIDELRAAAAAALERTWPVCP